MPNEELSKHIIKRKSRRKYGINICVSDFDLYERGIIDKPLKETLPENIEEVKNLYSKNFHNIMKCFKNRYIKTWEDLEEILLSKTYCRGTFKSNYRKTRVKGSIVRKNNDNFEKQDLLCLDIDDNIHPSEYINRLVAFNIKPNFVYSSIRDSEEHRKFRIVYVLPESITVEEKEKLEFINNTINKRLKGDQKTKDYSRSFFPGKSIIYKNYNIDFDTNDQLIDDFKFLFDQELGGVFKDTDNIDMESDSYHKKDYIYKLVFIEDLKFKIGSSDSDSDSDSDNGITPLKKVKIKLVSRKEKIVRNYNFDTKRFKILDCFLNEDYRFGYDILFGLASNLKWIVGGRKRFFERLDYLTKLGRLDKLNKDGMVGHKETYPSSYSNSLLRAFKNDDLLSMRLENFSPFKEDHKYKNLLTDKLGWGNFIRTQEIKKISLKEAEEGFLKSFKSVLNQKTILSKEQESFLEKHNIDSSLYDDNHVGQINIFKLPTGLGKTQALINLKGVIIATPTNKLKNEIHDDRMKVDTVKTPDPVIFSDPDLRDEYDLLIQSGIDTSNIITSIINSGSYKTYDIKESDILQCENYKSDNKECMCTEEDTTVVTTHTRLVFHNFNKKKPITIFDEDPLNELIKEGSILLSDFEKFEKSPIKNYMNKLKDYFSNCEEQKFYHKDNYKPSKKVIEFLFSRQESSLIRLFEKSKSFIITRITKPGKDQGRKVINFFEDYTHLLKKRNTIILSATINPEIYKALYGEDNVNVYEWDNVEITGNVIQDTSRSYSMNRMSKLIESNDIRLKEIIKSSINYKKVINLDKRDIFGGDIQMGMPIITHQKKRRWIKQQGVSEDDIKLYFGNTSGFDSYRGKDMIVLGTPHRPPNLYLKYLIDGKDEIDLTMDEKGREVERKGFRWRMKTYNDEVLSMLQLSDIETELIQAIGRGRALREDCKIYVYSNFPLSITTKFK